MSACGGGRGRGWLNLAKNADLPRPGGLTELPHDTSPPPPINTVHRELIDRIEKISLGDDGIMFNRKMKFIQEYWLQDCSTPEDFEESFEHVYKACLCNMDLASKLVTLVAARTFIAQQIHGRSIWTLFLTHLQRDFENSNQLQTQSPPMFRNCVHMMGEFLRKARVSSGSPLLFLAPPFMSCLELLLNSRTLPDLILFTNQLYLNGMNLKNATPEELVKLGNKIRSVLISESQQVRENKLWLLLALDVLNNIRFGVLPTEIYRFYEDQLGSVPMSNFQKSQDPLSIQTVHSSKILDSYQSNVNVLQISTSPSETTPNDTQGSHYASTADYNNQPPKDVSLKSKEKAGRPILGSGARLIKKGNEENGAWSSKQNSSSGRNNKKSPSSHKSNKGWEHDDRFENDYN